MADEDVVAREHHRGDGPLAEEGRKPQAAHVAHVAAGQAQALPARLHPAEADDVAPAGEVGEDHRRTDHIAETRGQRRAEHAPVQQEDEHVVEHDVDQGRNGIAPHRIVGRTVEPDEEHAGAEQGAERQEGNEPVHVLEHEGLQPLRAAQQPGHLRSEEADRKAVGGQNQRRNRNGLRHVDACRLDLAVRKVDRGHDRSPHTEHQPHARIDEEQRRGDVHRGQRIAADTAPDEDAVRDDECGRKQHPQHRGDQQPAEQPRNLHVAEVDTVFHHRFFRLLRVRSAKVALIPNAATGIMKYDEIAKFIAGRNTGPPVPPAIRHKAGRCRAERKRTG